MSDTAVTREKPEGYVFGRPTGYSTDLCGKVIEWGSLGKSRAWMAGKIGVSYQTLLNWERDHQDFFDALARAEMMAQMHWEDQGHDNLTNREFQSSVWSRSMAARFPKMWREKHAVVGGDEGDNPVKQETHHTGLDEFARRIASISARTATDGGNEPPDGAAAG